MARLSERFERISKGEKKRGFALFEAESQALLHIPIEDILPDPNQPRQDLGDLEGLKASIAEHGMMQPLVVSPNGSDKYLIIAGERRYTAARALAMDAVPAIVRTIEEHQRLELQLVENLHRKDLSPLEEARSYQRLIHDYNLTQEEVAKRIGKSVATVNQTLRILTLPEKLTAEFQTSENVSKSVLLEIAKQPTAEKQQAMWEQAKQGEMTVKKARAQKGRTRGEAAPIRPAQPMHYRYPIQTDDALVTLTFDRPSATTEEIVAALEQALDTEKARLSRRPQEARRKATSGSL
jgi:ParB family chromosome partitioning protein